MQTLERAEPLGRAVDLDPITEAAILPFDLDVDTLEGFRPYKLPELPDDFSIGLIVGASGSGKSTLLDWFGNEEPIHWDHTKPIAGHFDSPEEAAERLYAVGLNSVPTWIQPYWALSNGQKFRADLARRIGDHAVIDEFTSVVDRNVAKAASRAIRAYVDRRGIKRMVFASCHHDVIPWLQPDWIIDTDSGVLTMPDERYERRWWAEHLKEGQVVGRLSLA